MGFSIAKPFSNGVPPSLTMRRTRGIEASGFAPSALDRLFLMQLLRKETVDASLDTALKLMNARVEQQQKLNQLLANFDAFINDAGNRHLTAEEAQLLASVGFNVGEDGQLKADDIWDGANRRYRGVEKLIAFDSSHSLPRDSGSDGFYLITKDKVKTFKDALTQHIATLSAGNELQMMSLQKLMNQASEAMQAATSQLKAQHDINMAIIRNIA